MWVINIKIRRHVSAHWTIISPNTNRVLVHSLSAHYGIPYCLHTQHNVSTHWIYQYRLCLDWWWLNEPKYVAEILILITNMCCVYWLNKLLNLLLFGDWVPSIFFTCSGNIGSFFYIRILEIVNFGSAESLLAL